MFALSDLNIYVYFFIILQGNDIQCKGRNKWIHFDELQCELSLFLLLAHLNPFVPVNTERLHATE